MTIICGIHMILVSAIELRLDEFDVEVRAP
jgi:hypothetical protein